ncbi:MAG: ABC transporter ATP-binding protein [Lysobacterales bacterium]
MANPLLHIDNLQVDYPARDRRAEPVAALRLDSLTLDPGQVLAVCGPSGCGKTTLGQALMGLLPANAVIRGTCTFANSDLTTLSDRQWRTLRGQSITGMSQDATAALNPVLRVGRQLKQVGCRPAQANALLRELGLPLGRDWLKAFPHELSGGQCQRVALALALACEPQLLIADEPTAALDEQSALEVMTLMLDQAQRRKMAVLLITHDLSMLSALGVAHVALAPSETNADGVFASVPRPREQEPSRALLTIEDLTVRYPKADPAKPALDRVSLCLKVGTTTAVVGPSGSGKSTLARAVMGLVTPAAGQIRLYDQVLAPQWRRDRLPIQVVLQDTFGSLNPRQTVSQVLAESLAQGGTGADKTEDSLHEVGLDRGFLKRFPHELSGGQRQRVALARALALSPALVVLDEAFSALDIPIRDALLDLLLKIQSQRPVSYLMITHDTTRLASIAHDTAVLELGRLRGFGPTPDILPNYLMGPDSVTSDLSGRR